ncbi:MAG TPA: acyltransferase [Steroidobacteraceae bacterium]|nr:acyltransferase [Steroidobacteraceae bacterium]
MHPDVPPRAASGSLPNLDAMRALAVLLVLASHVMTCLESFGLYHFDPLDRQLGRLGVLLFFVHTCFVLTASLDRAGLADVPLLRTFYIRRAFRIYPLALLCIALTLLLQIPPAPWQAHETPSIGAVLSNLALTMNLTATTPLSGPMWTLPIEVQMYLALPFVFLLTKRARDPGRLAALFVVAMALGWLLPKISGRLYGAQFGPCFLAGVIAYAWYRHVAARFPGKSWVMLLAVLVPAYLGAEALVPGLHPIALQYVTCLLVGLVLPLFRQSGASVFNRLTRAVARYSYGIYLFHLIAMWVGLFWLRPASPFAGWLTALLVLVVLAVGGYHLVEAPAIRLAVRLTGQRRAAAGGALDSPPP